MRNSGYKPECWAKKLVVRWFIRFDLHLWSLLRDQFWSCPEFTPFYRYASMKSITGSVLKLSWICLILRIRAMKYIAGSDFKLSWIYPTDYSLMNQLILYNYYYKKLIIYLNLLKLFTYLMGLLPEKNTAL